MQEVPHYHLHILGGRVLGRLVEAGPETARTRVALARGLASSGKKWRMTCEYVAIPTETVRHYQAGRSLEANGQVPERSGLGRQHSCRHCLKMIPKDWMLMLAHRPFPGPQPYAEVGPDLPLRRLLRGRWGAIEMPELLASPDYIVRGYGADDRIVYGTGGVVPTGAILARAHGELFGDPRVAYLHVRSARNNCYQCRIDRERFSIFRADAQVFCLVGPSRSIVRDPRGW